MRNRHKTYLAVTAVAGLALAVTALATPGSGVLSATVFARAAFASPVNIRILLRNGKGPEDNQLLKMVNAKDTVVQQIVMSPGGQTGWHSHPGPVIVLIKAGTMTFYDGDDPTCSPITYNAGQSFVDSGQGHVHIARNESASADLEIWAVYLDVPVGGAFRTDAPAPGNCAF